jgi:ABC-2 type transport system permease protein
MTTRQKLISLKTILSNEVKRIFRVWTQTLVPPIMSNVLYFVIFGGIVGSQISNMNGFKYMEYIFPGIAMMGIITSSFMHSVSSFFFSKFQKTIEEIVVSPTPYSVVLLGYMLGGVMRGLMIGLIISIVGMIFTDISVHSYSLMILMALLTSSLFSLIGITNAIYAKGFDGISIIPNFVITPLTYLGGVFYSISLLPVFWQGLSKFNPILYMIDGFRYAVLGKSDININYSLSLLFILVIIFFALNIYLFKSGRGFKV